MYTNLYAGIQKCTQNVDPKILKENKNKAKKTHWP
jgi:hypothetical protein